VRHIDCSDFLPLGIACKHVLEAETEEELVEAARAHAREEHPRAEFDEESVRALIARPT
jgi:predicted small metal-binding protein